LWPLEIAKAAFGIANPLYPEQFQPRLMLQQPIAGGVFSSTAQPNSQVTVTAMAAKKRIVNQFSPAAVTNIAAMSTVPIATFKRSSIQS